MLTNVLIYFLIPKPSNIFFSMDGLVKIGDFGLVTNTLDQCEVTSSTSKSKERLLKHTNDVGTHLYMSPEQVMTPFP